LVIQRFSRRRLAAARPNACPPEVQDAPRVDGVGRPGRRAIIYVWRICFIWDDGAYRVEITDYH
jgi:hypothetical protein